MGKDKFGRVSNSSVTAETSFSARAVSWKYPGKMEEPSLSLNPQRGAALGSVVPQTLQVVNGAQINLPSGLWAGRGAMETVQHKPRCRERGQLFLGISLTVCQPRRGSEVLGSHGVLQQEHDGTAQKMWHAPWW